MPEYVSDTAEQTPEHSSTRVEELSHSVIVLSALQTASDPVQGGKQDDHHEGGVGAERSAHVRLSSIDSQDGEITRALNAP